MFTSTFPFLNTGFVGVVVALALASAGLGAGGKTESGTIRLLVITGGHNFDESFSNLFEGQPGVKWEHRAHSKGTSDVYSQAIADDFDVVVLYDMPLKITEPQKKNFLALFEKGKGLVVLHHALVNYQDWPVFENLAGAKYHLKEAGSPIPSTYEHDVEFDLQVVDSEHPVLEGIESFTIFDEIYGGMTYRNDIQPLLVTDHPESTPIVAWAKTYEKSRIVAIQPGHGPTGYENPNFQRLLWNAIRWVAPQ